MIRDIGMVQQWLDGRKRLLGLVEPKIITDPMVSMLVGRCKTADSDLLKKVLERASRTETGKKP